MNKEENESNIKRGNLLRLANTAVAMLAATARRKQSTPSDRLETPILNWAKPIFQNNPTPLNDLLENPTDGNAQGTIEALIHHHLSLHSEAIRSLERLLDSGDQIRSGGNYLDLKGAKIKTNSGSVTIVGGDQKSN